jgi:hypothetical protein
MGIPMHPRWQLVKTAENELRKSVLDFIEQHNEQLTYAELLSVVHTVLSSELQALLWSAVKQEREEGSDGPDDPPA